MVESIRHLVIDVDAVGRLFFKVFSALPGIDCKTYPDAEYENIWRALFVMNDPLGDWDGGYDYPVDDDKRVTDYLRHVRELPQDTERIF